MPASPLHLVPILLLLGLVAAATAAPLPQADIAVGPHRLTVELALEPADRQIGLMHRPSLPADQGMLFVFPNDGRRCMWMRNTLIPLSVAFIAADGSILNLADMAPLNDATHCSRGPIRYALEVNRGWFAERGIAAGDRIGGLQQLPPAR
ncbi:DUF192 domain-containing protein [Thiococcus pfennigii]|uniref:DUF192 domain-containing protein n=1 Tax=Thiococcus pfennigii TaxID=1057 RepID=UPI001906B742|nr:DUF192 domain-containing protein [Thiococcus pfennigii]MBK1733590.1 hypothetical protein [Thiococcus pfennigii]